MKHLYVAIPLFTLIVLLGCASSTKMLQKRQYDMAIAKSVQELDKKPGNRKEIGVLAKAYKIANDQDNDRIKLLVQSNEPQVWEEVYSTYCRLKYRKDLVKPLGNSIGQAIGFEDVDYDRDIIDSKNKAADYLFGEGKKSLARNTRPDAREAYGYFGRVKEYLPAFPGIDDSLQRAYEKGTAYAFFKVQNTSGQALPGAYQEDLTKISVADLQNKWIVFDTRQDGKMKYDYGIVLTIRKIKISPELAARHEEVETKQVDDGSEPVLDAQGAAMKDSLGNELHKTKFKSISCSYTRISLGKTATVNGTLDILDNRSGQMIKTDQVSAESKWEFVYIMAKGDVEALSPETRKLTSLRIPVYPSNDDMILRTADTLKMMAKDIIYANRRLLQ